MTAATAAAIAAAVSTGFVAVVTVWASRHQTRASAASILVETSTELLLPLREQLAELRAEVARLREETAECHRQRDADRVRLATIEAELARYKAGPNARHQGEPTP